MKKLLPLIACVALGTSVSIAGMALSRHEDSGGVSSTGLSTISPQKAAEDEVLYSQTFDSEASLADIVILDANGDGDTWKWHDSGAMRYSFSSNAADDYIVLPPLHLEAGSTYVLSFDGYNNGTNFPEKIAGYVGTEATAAGLSATCIVQPTIIKSATPITLSGEFVPEATGDYYFAVKACSDDMEYYLFTDNITVKKSSGNSLEPVELPYSETFDTAESVLPFTIIDSNQDGKTWEWNSEGYMRYPFGSNAADDWMVLPPMALKAGNTYKFETDVWCKASGFPEKVAVYAGKSTDAASLTTEVIAPTSVASTTPFTLEGTFSPAEDGLYCFAVKACSESMMYYLFVDNIRVTEDIPVIETVEIPFKETFDTVDSLDKFEIVNNNHDAKTWVWNDKGYMSYSFCSNAADDWLVLPAMELEAGTAYTVSADLWCKASGYPERFAIYAGNGKTPDKLTQEVVAPTLIASTNPIQMKGDFTPGESGLYYFAVKACSDAMMYELYVDNIEVTRSVTVEGIDLPYSNNFENAEDLGNCTVEDANHDGYTWVYDDGSLVYKYNPRGGADDWFILPPMNMEEDMAYLVKYKAHATNGYTERIAVYGGTAPQALTQMICPAAELTSDQQTEAEGIFIAPATGVYYIGVQACSDAAQFRLYLDAVSVSGPQPSSIPGAITDLTARPDSTGVAKAFLSFTAPTKSTAGKDLSTIDKIHISRNGDLIASIDVQPGQIVEYTDEMAPEGMNTYSVVSENQAGTSPAAMTEVFVGFDVPATVTGVKVANGDSYGKVIISWDPVKEDSRGLPLSASQVTYAIVENHGNSQIMMADGVTVTEGVMQVCADDQDQRFVTYSVFARNSKGYGYGCVSEKMSVGRPYESPFHQSLLDGEPIRIYPEGDLYWVTEERESVGDTDGDGLIFKCLKETGAETNSGSLVTGRVSLKGTSNPVFSFNHYCLAGDENVYSVEVNDGSGFKLLDESFEGGSFENDHWANHQYSLSEYVGKAVQLKVNVEILSEPAVGFLDNLMVVESRQNDLTLSSITAPSAVVPGESFNICARIENFALAPSATGQVRVMKDEDEIRSIDLPSLNSGEIAFVDLEVSMDATETEDCIYKVEIVAGGDEYPGNNTQELTVTPVLPPHPVPSGLKATGYGEIVLLEWDAPDLSKLPTKPTVEEFESMASFATDSADGWKFLDYDKAPVGGFMGIAIPNVASGNQASWFVFDSSYPQFNASFDAASGSKYIAALYNANGATNDDWAISPELSGFAQHVSFKARAYSAGITETIALMVSDTDDDPASFHELARYQLTSDEWLECNAYIPRDTRYMAFRYISTDSFMVMIDDVKFAAADGEEEEYALSGYNIYHDTEKINNEILATCSYEDLNNTAWMGTYRVSAVYDNNRESALSAPAVVTSGVAVVNDADLKIFAGEGFISISGDFEGDFLICDLNGTVVFGGSKTPGTMTFEVMPGLYIVTSKNYSAKIMVK